jgi:hypothetical protein
MQNGELWAAAVTARYEAVAAEQRGCVAPNRCASLGVIRIEHCVFRRYETLAIAMPRLHLPPTPSSPHPLRDFPHKGKKEVEHSEGETSYWPT